MGFNLYEQDSAEMWRDKHKIKLVWTDPPFGTGKVQEQGGCTWHDTGSTTALHVVCTALKNVLPRMTSDGVICVCADHRVIHDVVSVMKWDIYHQGDVVWTFGLGRPRTNWWPVRHNTIATFTVSKELPAFDSSAVPREVRKAPKAGYSADKPAGSVWDYTMSNTDPERVGYPNQKPLHIIEPFVLAHTKKWDVVADPFMGSGSTAIAALRNRRNFVGQDTNAQALKVTRERIRRI